MYRWRQEFEISKIIHRGEDDKLLEYIDRSISQTKSFTLKLIQIIRELLLIRNFDLIRKIFELKKMNAQNFNYDGQVLIGMSIGYLISVVNKKNKAFNELVLNENFQDLVITIFVDYASLKTYYSKIIKTIYKNSSRKNVRVFCEGILNLNLFFILVKRSLEPGFVFFPSTKSGLITCKNVKGLDSNFASKTFFL